MTADIRAILFAEDRIQVEVQPHETIKKYAQSASKLVDWLEGNIPEGLIVFSVPEIISAVTIPLIVKSVIVWKSYSGRSHLI